MCQITNMSVFVFLSVFVSKLVTGVLVTVFRPSGMETYVSDKFSNIHFACVPSLLKNVYSFLLKYLMFTYCILDRGAKSSRRIISDLVCFQFILSFHSLVQGVFPLQRALLMMKLSSGNNRITKLFCYTLHWYWSVQNILKDCIFLFPNSTAFSHFQTQFSSTIVFAVSQLSAILIFKSECDWNFASML